MRNIFFPRLGKVNHFAAISESVKREMVKDLGIEPSRITVTPLGLDAQYVPSPPEKIPEVLSKYGLVSGEYIVSVGTKEPRKNLKRLLAAYAALMLFAGVFRWRWWGERGGCWMIGRIF